MIEFWPCGPHYERSPDLTLNYIDSSVSISDWLPKAKTTIKTKRSWTNFLFKTSCDVPLIGLCLIVVILNLTPPMISPTYTVNFCRNLPWVDTLLFYGVKIFEKKVNLGVKILLVVRSHSNTVEVKITTVVLCLPLPFTLPMEIQTQLTNERSRPNPFNYWATKWELGLCWPDPWPPQLS